MVLSLAEMHPSLDREWSDRNLPLRPEKISEKSRSNVWWKCSVCGYEWQSVVYTRVNGSQCPVCVGRNVLKGVNDLLSTDPELAAEWNYDKNQKGPDEYIRTSMYRVWWKGSCGHEWSDKIYSRAIHKKGCKRCESEFLEVLPQLAVLYYSGKYGLETKFNDETTVGMKLDTLIPSAGIAIDVNKTPKKKSRQKKIAIKRYLCRKIGIDLYTLCDERVPDNKFLVYRGTSPEDLLSAIIIVFNRANLYIAADPEKDLEIIRSNYFRWRSKEQ